MLKVVLHGYGKMGKLVEKLAFENQLEIVGIIGKNVASGKISYNDLLTLEYDTIIDFSNYLAIDELLDTLEKRPKKAIIATTKLTKIQQQRISDLSTKVAVFQDYNTSYGVYVLNETVKFMTKLLSSYDIEVIEKHHKYKVDAPSGTAQRLINSIQKSSNNGLTDIIENYSQVDQKTAKMIGVHAIRSGNITGKHEVIFGSDFDLISIKHEALSKELFAHGAIEICHKLSKKEAGLFKLEQVFKENK